MQFESNIPSFDEIQKRNALPQRSRFFGGLYDVLVHFSPAERLLLYALSAVLAVSAFALLVQVNTLVSTEVPTQGGALTEGAVGTPRFINPVLAVSQTDLDLTTLVYSGLLRATSEDGANAYRPDLAESYDISEDGTVYTFHLRKGLVFHDGEPLTAKDVLFTVALAQNPDIKSPRRADWEGVAAEAPDDHTVVFTLPHAYAPFRENATMGIVPKHLWENVAAEEFPFSSINTHPIGSGPYSIEDVTLDSTGAPREYVLDAFRKFALGRPNIARITYRTYSNEEELVDAYESGDIEGFVASSPQTLPRDIVESKDARELVLARTFGVFFNQNHAPVLTDLAARRALIAAVDSDTIIRQVLGGHGRALSSPIPPGLFAEAEEATTTGNHAEKARAILEGGGWKWNATSTAAGGSEGAWTKNKQTLTLALATTDQEELVATANAIKEAWSAIGVHTDVSIYPLQEFNQTILRPRAYDAILFGEVVGRSLDLFAFWHSSQRNDPGLNLALYTNSSADKALASSRQEIDPEKRKAFIKEFLEVLDNDAPAMFIYSPTVTYIVPSRLRGLELGTLTTPSDRFISVFKWYRDTERVWNVFSRQ